jgi:hypothetical protein
MRAFALLLIAANLALYAWIAQYAPPDPASDPRPLARQIEPEKIPIVSGRELAAAPLPAANKPVPKPAPEPPPAACLEWGSFAQGDAALAEQALAPLALGARLGQRRSEEASGWWVFMAPQGSREAAQKKAAELKALGVSDYFIVQEAGRWRWAISLGVFSSQDAAKSRLEALRVRNVRTAQVGERESAAGRIWFQVRGAEAPLAARLKELARAFPGTELRQCP